MNEKNRIEPKERITKVIVVKGTVFAAIPADFLMPLGIDQDSYLRHYLTPEGMMTRKVKINEEMADRKSELDSIGG